MTATTMYGDLPRQWESSCPLQTGAGDQCPKQRGPVLPPKVYVERFLDSSGNARRSGLPKREALSGG